MPIQYGKCLNRSGCSLAYTGELIRFDGEPRCPECGEPLVTQRAPRRSRRIWFGLPAAVLAGIVIALYFLYPWTPPDSPKVVPKQDIAKADPAVTADPAPSSPAVAEAFTPEMPPDLGESSATPAASSAASPAASATATPATGVEGSPSVPAGSPASVRQTAEAPPAPTSSVVDHPQELPKEQIDTTREDVLKRINAMPRMTASEKERLISKVQTARSMERLRIIRFDRGQTNVQKTTADALISSLKTPAMRDKLADPTLILVIAGYADSGGDAATNQRISDERAENVGRLLKQRGQILNVIHTVGMGSTELLDGKRPDQNRAVEIWAVVP